MNDKERNLSDIKQILLKEFRSNIISIIIYGSTLGDDYCRLSDYDCLIIFKDVDFATLQKIQSIKTFLKEQKDINVDFNSHIMSDLPDVRKEVFWHNNRGIYVQKELAQYGKIIYGKKVFKDVILDRHKMIEEAVKDVNSLNYQARKLLLNKELDTTGKVLLMKWCIYGVLYILATIGIFPDSRRKALQIFDRRFHPPFKAEQFLDVKTRYPENISKKEAEKAFLFLKYLDKLAFNLYQKEPKITEYRFNQDGMLIKAFLGGNRGNIVYAPGLPQFIDKRHELVRQITDLGYNLFVPVYKGTYESDGAFGVATSVESVEKTIEVVKRGSFEVSYLSKPIAWCKKLPYVIGFSYGALPALLQTKENRKTILICPFLSLQFHKKNSSGEYLESTLNYLKYAYSNTYRFSENDFISELQRVEYPSSKNNLSIIYSSEDESIPVAEIEFFKKKYNCQLIDKKGKHNVAVDNQTLVNELEKHFAIAKSFRSSSLEKSKIKF